MVVLRIVVPLPLQTKFVAAEIVVGLECCRLGRQRILPHVYWFTNAVAVDVYTDERPVILPTGRLQMHHTTQHWCFLEMIEPPLSIGRIDQCTLVRTIDGSRALLQHDTLLIRAINVTRAEHCLPPLTYSTFGNDEIIVTIALQEFGAFSHRTGVDRHAIVHQLSTIGRHSVYDNWPCTMTTTT